MAAEKPEMSTFVNDLDKKYMEAGCAYKLYNLLTKHQDIWNEPERFLKDFFKLEQCDQLIMGLSEKRIFPSIRSKLIAGEKSFGVYDDQRFCHLRYCREKYKQVISPATLAKIQDTGELTTNEKTQVKYAVLTYWEWNRTKIMDALWVLRPSWAWQQDFKIQTMFYMTGAFGAAAAGVLTIAKRMIRKK